MGTRHDYSEVTEGVETDLQLEEVGPTVIILLINLEVSAVEVVREIFSHSLPVPPKPAICLQELFKGGLQHVHNRSVIFPLLFERGRGEPQNVCGTGEREREIVTQLTAPDGGTHVKSLKPLFFSTASLAMSVATIQMALLTETGGWRDPWTKSSFTCVGVGIN